MESQPWPGRAGTRKQAHWKALAPTQRDSTQPQLSICLNTAKWFYDISPVYLLPISKMHILPFSNTSPPMSTYFSLEPLNTFPMTVSQTSLSQLCPHPPPTLFPGTYSNFCPCSKNENPSSSTIIFQPPCQFLFKTKDVSIYCLHF